MKTKQQLEHFLNLVLICLSYILMFLLDFEEGPSIAMRLSRRCDAPLHNDFEAVVRCSVEAIGGWVDRVFCR